MRDTLRYSTLTNNFNVCIILAYLYFSPCALIGPLRNMNKDALAMSLDSHLTANLCSR